MSRTQDQELAEKMLHTLNAHRQAEISLEQCAEEIGEYAVQLVSIPGKWKDAILDISEDLAMLSEDEKANSEEIEMNMNRLIKAIGLIKDAA